MRLKHLYWIFFPLILLLIFWMVKESSSEQEINDAYSHYVEGEKAATISVRKEAFNKSLEIYSSLERAYSPAYGTGKLFFNIANCYYQLEQYPLAIYYYYASHALRPRDPKVTQNLQIAQEKLGIAPDKKNEDIASFLSLPERLQLFFALSILALVFASIRIWFGKIFAKRLTSFFSVLAMIVFLNLVYIKFLAPLEGILIHAASLYRDAGEQYAKVSEKPLLSGIKVEVLDTQHNGTWLKIQTRDGEVGFISSDSIRVISL